MSTKITTNFSHIGKYDLPVSNLLSQKQWNIATDTDNFKATSLHQVRVSTRKGKYTSFPIVSYYILITSQGSKHPKYEKSCLPYRS